MAGSEVALGARDHLIHIWSLADGVCIRRLQGHTDAVLCVAAAGK
eukprot:s8707_g1.t1